MGREEHAAAYDKMRADDVTRKMYGKSFWRRRYQPAMLANNPICQRLINGEQCHNPATLVHHLLSPRERPDLFTTPSNTVCLCAGCHPGGMESTPLWRPNVDYVPTVFKNYLCEETK